MNKQTNKQTKAAYTGFQNSKWWIGVERNRIHQILLLLHVVLYINHLTVYIYIRIDTLSCYIVLYAQVVQWTLDVPTAVSLPYRAIHTAGILKLGAFNIWFVMLCYVMPCNTPIVLSVVSFVVDNIDIIDTNYFIRWFILRNIIDVRYIDVDYPTSYGSTWNEKTFNLSDLTHCDCVLAQKKITRT